jgi:uncharacterized membrane protein YhhN
MREGLLLTVVSLTVMLVAGYFRVSYLPGIAKCAASVGFLWVAFSAGAFQSTFGMVMFAGLFFSFWGDAFLIGSGQNYFLAGLVSFFLAHVAYGIAFAMYSFNPLVTIGALVVMIPHTIAIYRWLSPHVDQELFAPVVAYMAVITLMVALAAATWGRPGAFFIVIGAVLFYISDLFVARGRFVESGMINGLIGLPVYYGAQLILAYSISEASKRLPIEEIG